MGATAPAPEPQQEPDRPRPRLDPLRHHRHYQSDTSGPQYAGGSSFMERVSERVASGMGTVPFLVV